MSSRKRNTRHHTSVQTKNTQSAPLLSACSTPQFSRVTSSVLWIVSILAVLLVIAARIHLLDIPLERDEGEYGYAGQLMLHGIPPYKEAVNMKLPGTYAAYAVIISIFGQTARGVHLGLLFVNMASILLMFFLARRMFGSSAMAALAAALLGIGTLGIHVLGFAAHATQFVLPCLLAGFALLVRRSGLPSFLCTFAGGILLGLAIVMKQHAAIFVPLGVIVLLFDVHGGLRRSWKALGIRTLLLLLGSTIPLGIVCGIMAWCGVYDSFVFWTFSYAHQYISETPFSSAYSTAATKLKEVVSSSPIMWYAAGAGCIVFIMRGWRRTGVLYSVLFAVFGFLTACPGYYFRPHYFIPMMLGIALLAVTGIAAVLMYLEQSKLPKYVTTAVNIALAAAVLFTPFIIEAKPFFIDNPVTTIINVYGNKLPFSQSEVVAAYIKQHTMPLDKIAVFGNEPELYFLSQRRGGTRFLYFYPFVEDQAFTLEMQKKMIAEVEASRPSYIVFDTWVAIKRRARPIMEWFNPYVTAHYTIVGIVDMQDNTTTYVWDKHVAGYQPKSSCDLYILKRVQ